MSLLRQAVMQVDPDIQSLDPDASIQKALNEVGLPIVTEEEQKKAAIEKEFQETLLQNRKDADKKAQENKDLADLLFISVVLDEARAYVQRIIKQEIKVEEFLAKEKAEKIAYYEEKQNRLVIDDIRTLTTMDDKNNLQSQAKDLFDFIKEMQEDLIKKNKSWGEDWKDGLGSKVDKVMKAVTVKTFLGAIDGHSTINDPEKVNKSFENLKDDVGRALKDRPSLLDVQKRIKAIYDPEPQAQPLIVLGSNAPLPPPPPSMNSSFNTVVKNKYELNTEILFAAKAKELFQQLCKEGALVIDKIVPDEKTEFGKNAFVRLGARFAANLKSELKAFQKDIVEFTETTLAIDNLGKMAEHVKAAINKLANTPVQEIRRLSR